MTTKRRKISIIGLDLVPLQKKAYLKFIRQYYKGSNNIQITFDNKLNCWGEHFYESSNKTHYIRISPLWSSHEEVTSSTRNFSTLRFTTTITKVCKKDTIARILQVTLHELKHAMQCDKNPIRYSRCNDNKHPGLKNNFLSYSFSLLESEAEGWSLMNIYQAIERYESWSNE